MSAQLQTQFPIRAARFCVLLTVNSVRDRLPDFDLDEDAVLLACNEHWLSPAIDIGLQSRRELRVAPSAVAFFDESGGAKSRRVSLADFHEEVLRGHDGKPWILGERVRAILSCGGTHINNLIDDGELMQLPGTNYRRGHNGSAQILLSSFKDFLKRRLQ